MKKSIEGIRIEDLEKNKENENGIGRILWGMNGIVNIVEKVRRKKMGKKSKSKDEMRRIGMDERKEEKENWKWRINIERLEIEDEWEMLLKDDKWGNWRRGKLIGSRKEEKKMRRELIIERGKMWLKEIVEEM